MSRSPLNSIVIIVPLATQRSVRAQHPCAKFCGRGLADERREAVIAAGLGGIGDDRVGGRGGGAGGQQ